MVLLYFILFVFAGSDTTYVEQTKEQVLNYVSNIKASNNVTLNNWAIHEIATINCKGLQIVRSSIGDLPLQSQYYQDKSCTDLAELRSNTNGLSFWDKTQAELFQKIIDDRIKITTDFLAPDDYSLIHFLLLMSDEPMSYYSKEYLQAYFDNWIEYAYSDNSERSIKYYIITSNIVRIAYILDRYDVIREIHTSFTEGNLLPNSLYKLKLLGAFDYTSYIFGNHDKSLKLQREHSLPLAKFIGNKEEMQSIKIRQGAYLISLGKFEESKEIYEELYADSLQIDNQYNVFTNLGVSYIRLGYANKYISLQLKAIDQEIKNYKSLLGIYRNLFLYYTSVKNTSTALNYINEAKEVALANQDTTELALIDSYLGTFYWTNHNDEKKALMHLNAAQQILSPKNNFTKYLNLLFEKGSIYNKIDSLENALEVFEQAKELSLSKSNSTRYVESLINLASVQLKRNNLSLVAEYLKEIKIHPLSQLDFPLLIKYYTVTADYYYKTNRKRLAIEIFSPVIQQVTDRAKNTTDSKKGYWLVEEEYLDAFELMIELYMDNGRQREALSLLDQFKTINDASLYNNPLIKASKLSEEELAEEKKLNQKLQQLRKDFLNADPDKRFALNAEIDRTSAAREQILAKSHLAKTQKLPPMWTIQRSIASNELLLHFTEIGQNLYVGYLTDDAVQIKKFSFDAPVQKLFEQVGDELASGATNLVHLHQLYKILELDDISGHIQQLTVIPDNALYRIPLEVIPVQTPNSAFSFGSARYMIEDYRFRYFTSLHEYATNRRSFHKKLNTDFSGFAISNFSSFHSTNLPSLPFATIETKNIVAELSSLSDKNIYEGNAATKQAFKQNMASSRLLHVATHSEVSDQDPLFSTIYLNNGLKAPDTLQSEQALYAYELFDTPLNSEFVMLNSCSSGSGRYIQGSGIMGISRALRYAGAKSLALNLWSVNDKVAADFATDFYHSLNEGSTKSEAIRKAKLNQLRKANANPHFWGAYMMIGNPAPITGKTAHPWLLYAFLSISTVGLGYLSYKKAA